MARRDSADPYGTSPVVYVPPEVVFPGLTSDFDAFRSLLSQLSRGDALCWCARLNLILSNPANPDELAKQHFGIDVLGFTPEELGRLNAFATDQGGASSVRILFRGQLLETMRWVSLFCTDHPNDGDTFLQPDALQIFRQVVLIAGREWMRRIYGDRLRGQGDVSERREHALGALRASMAETSSGVDPLVALGRGKAFMDLLGHADARFPDDFRRLTGLSLDEYYTCWCALMTHVVNILPAAAVDPKDSGIFSIPVFSTGRPVFAAFLQRESQTADELRESIWGLKRAASFDDVVPFGAGALRDHPILRLADGRAIILDPVLCAEKVAVGPVFEVLRARGQEILGQFGHVFEEHIRRTLGSMYPSRPFLADRLVSPVLGRNNQGEEVEIADACVTGVDEIALVEAKAVWVRDDTVLTADPTQYLAQLRRKYGAEPDEDGEPRKGVAQLARSIGRVAAGTWTANDDSLLSARVIYPVLLVHDTLLSAPVHGHFLAKEFERLLEPDDLLASGYMRKGRFHVAPLVLMTIDDLELLETSVEEFALIDLLRDYSAQCPDRLVSLHNYLAGSRYAEHLRMSKTAARRTLDLLHGTMHALFGDVGELPSR